jgi:hypothetical protein
MVHGLRDLCDGDQAHSAQVGFALHHAHDLRKLPKLIRLCRSQWISFEERNDVTHQITESSDFVPIQMLPVVVMSPIDEDVTASEELLHIMQNMHTPRSLYDYEDRLYLPAESVRGIAIERHAEAAFTVNETDDPLLESWPFLLIVRTRHVFTAFPRAIGSR